jgi:hypothetical protein
MDGSGLQIRILLYVIKKAKEPFCGLSAFRTEIKVSAVRSSCSERYT